MFLNTYANSPENKIKNKSDWILNNIIFSQKFLEDIGHGISRGTNKGCKKANISN
jgi:hypothetical protein